MFVDTRFGDKKRYYLFPPKDANMRLPNEFTEGIVFVGRVISKGDREERPLLGTAFVVGIPSEDGSPGFYRYLVTARHVAKQLSLGGPWFIRMNKKDGESVDVQSESPVQWWYHATEAETVDVAVTPLPSLPEEIEYRIIESALFATDAVIRQRNIGYGDPVFIIGLFTRMAGKRRNFPIVRMGNIALMPAERIPGIEIDAEHAVESDVYLIEARSVGGLSGSPIFVRETVFLPMPVGKDSRRVEALLPGSFFLLGLMHGHWDVKEQEINEVQVRAVRRDRMGVNLGVAVVVPAQKIHEVLCHPELVKERRRADQARIAAEGTTIPDLRV